MVGVLKVYCVGELKKTLTYRKADRFSVTYLRFFPSCDGRKDFQENMTDFEARSRWERKEAAVLLVPGSAIRT
jgi:hypothetical protein